MKKIGVFGGTFDPVHNGHISKAQEALVKLKLDQVLWVVAGDPWMKSSEPLSDAKHRLEMIKIAIDGNSQMQLSDMEIRRKGPTYTVDTLKDIQSRNPHDELTLLVGSDLIQNFDQWKSPDEIFSLAKLAIFTRTAGAGDTQKIVGLYKSKDHRLEILSGPTIDVSSTLVRKAVSRRLSISEYVPKAVEKYIIENKLYLG
jgi:nicotinate-nucleotide adenylyltransferase